MRESVCRTSNWSVKNLHQSFSPAWCWKACLFCQRTVNTNPSHYSWDLGIRLVYHGYYLHLFLVWSETETCQTVLFFLLLLLQPENKPNVTGALDRTVIFSLSLSPIPLLLLFVFWLFWFILWNSWTQQTGPIWYLPQMKGFNVMKRNPCHSEMNFPQCCTFAAELQALLI